MASEYPKNLYRLTKAGAVEGRLFATEEEVEPGWEEVTAEMAAIMAATPRVEPPTKPRALNAHNAPAKVRELEDEIVTLKRKEADLIEAYGASKALTIAQAEQIAALNELLEARGEGDAEQDGDGAGDDNAGASQAARVGRRAKRQ